MLPIYLKIMRLVCQRFIGLLITMQDDHVQERLTQQILNDLLNTVQTNNVGVVLKASHSCISCKGVEDKGSSKITSGFSVKIATDSSIISILYKE